MTGSDAVRDKEMPMTTTEREYMRRINRVIDYIEDNLDQPLPLELLADVMLKESNAETCPMGCTMERGNPPVREGWNSDDRRCPGGETRRHSRSDRNETGHPVINDRIHVRCTACDATYLPVRLRHPAGD